MRPSRVTLVFSTTNRPAPEQAMLPRCARCQSVMEPSSAEYWHIGEMTTRLGSVMPPSWMGSNSLGSGNRDPFLREHLAQRLRERHGAGLVAVDAQRVGRHRDALAAQAGDIALLDHAEHLLHRGLRFLDHAARLVARRERAVVGVAPVREYLAIDRNVLLSCCFHHQGIRKRIEL